MRPSHRAASPTTHTRRRPQQAAAILTAAFAADLGWGVLVWLAMTTGARRGELCALRWDGVDLDRGALSVRSAIAQDGSRTWEKDTKTHQQRRIALDATTVGLLRAYRRECDEDAAALGVEISPSGRLFSARRTTRRGSPRRRSASATPGCAPVWAGT